MMEVLKKIQRRKQVKHINDENKNNNNKKVRSLDDKERYNLQHILTQYNVMNADI